MVAGRTTDNVPVVGDTFIMGANPEYMVVHRGDVVPDGYYLPDIGFVNQYQGLMALEAEAIGPWAIVAFFGGKFEGTGYGNGSLLISEVAEDESDRYYVDQDPSINDILVVAADPEDPQVYIPHVDLDVNVNDMCNIDGYDCTCEEIPDVYPPTRAPTFECPDVYVDYGMDVPAFDAA